MIVLVLINKTNHVNLLGEGKQKKKLKGKLKYLGKKKKKKDYWPKAMPKKIFELGCRDDSCQFRRND